MVTVLRGLAVRVFPLLLVSAFGRRPRLPACAAVLTGPTAVEEQEAGPPDILRVAVRAVEMPVMLPALRQDAHRLVSMAFADLNLDVSGGRTVERPIRRCFVGDERVDASRLKARPGDVRLDRGGVTRNSDQIVLCHVLLRVEPQAFEQRHKRDDATPRS